MSSSDDDWMPQMRPGGGGGGNTGQNAMMEARRRALQQQREAQQQQQQNQQQQQRPTTSGRRETTAAPPAPAKKAESSLPDFLAGLDDDDDQVSAAPATLHSPSQPTQIFPGAGATTAPTSSTTPTGTASMPASTAATGAGAAPLQPSHEATVEELQRQIAAKRKLLQSTKEREAALVEKWRVTKAQKQAEVEQLNGKIRRVWAAIEDEKSAAETKLREAQDQHESELRAARRSVEQEVKATYDAKIAEAQRQLSSAKAEEDRLRQLLEDKGGSAAAKNTVNTALTAAITAVLHKLDDVFQSEAADGLRMEAWRADLQRAVQREIQTSFAVGVESETQAERDEYERFFSEMLAFWRTAEDQERERLLKMDESLLTDLSSMAQQDLRRLQDEELAMERVYVESREAWAVEHQRLLQRELEAALHRREGELQEQRRQRHELHVDRLRDVEARHRDVMAKEEALHQQRLEQLRAFYAREEGLRAEQQRVEAAAQENVAQSAAVLKSVMATSEETAAALKAYEHAVEEARRQTEAQRVDFYREQEAVLERLHGLAATQCGNVDAERTALEDCAARLRLTTQTMDRHLQDEAAWLAEQEATYQRSRDEWAREYRRWQQLVQQERQAAEERFHAALAGLQESLQVLDVEEREVAVEHAALQRTFSEVEAAAQREIEALQHRAADVQSRAAAVAAMEARLARQKDATAEARRQLALAQQQLEEERADLQSDEARLRDMVEALRVARTRATLRAAIAPNPSHHGMQLLQGRGAGGAVAAQANGDVCVMNDRDAPDGERKETGGASVAVQQRERVASLGTRDGAQRGATDAAEKQKKPRRHRSDPSRLPNKIFQELNEQLNHLASGSGGAGEAFVPTMRWTDPAYPATALAQQRPHQQHHHQSQQQQQLPPRRQPHHSRERLAGPLQQAQQQQQQQQPPPPPSQRKSSQHHRQRSTPSPTAGDVPPPLAASPQSLRRERQARAHQTPSPTPQERGPHRTRQSQPQRILQRHVDPSSLPLTSESSPSLSLRGDYDWSPSANTFTNLVDFSDADTTTQSMR